MNWGQMFLGVEIDGSATTHKHRTKTDHVWHCVRHADPHVARTRRVPRLTLSLSPQVKRGEEPEGEALPDQGYGDGAASLLPGGEIPFQHYS